MEKFLEKLHELNLDHAYSKLEPLIKERTAFIENTGNDLVEKFINFYDELPDLDSSHMNLNCDAVEAGLRCEIDDDAYEKLYLTLKKFIPWRKGPFSLFGVDINTEWASNLKWDRFEKSIDLRDKKILDIGSSNGYYMFRAADSKPLFALGIEPFIPYYFQFMAVQKYLGLENVFSIPAFFDDLPDIENFYDVVFCMGVLYHRKSPLDMLSKIRKNIAKGGVLVLENLIIESDQPICLVPAGRYAKMKNVYFIPSIKTIETWLSKTGFRNMEVLDISYTTTEEQRRTEWTFAESLEDFLDSKDRKKTVEGYPAPLRAVIKAYA